MSERIKDTSVYDETKKDVDKLLSQYPQEKVLEAVLYVVDEKAIQELKDMQKLLFLEYSSSEAPLLSRKGKKGAPHREPYSLETLVKVINFDLPANAYQTFTRESWKQINDREKVFSMLDEELIKHENKVRAFTKRKLKADGVPPELQNDILNRIEVEIKEAQKEKEYIQDNFDALDVRISGYHERTQYAGLRWYVNKVKQADVNLRKQTPNVLWFREYTEDEKIRTDNELIHYLKEAKRAFGNVFYAPFSDNKPKED